MELLAQPSSERQFIMYEALREGADVETLSRRTFIKPWFIGQMKELVELEEQIRKYKGKKLPDALLLLAKKDGFSDRYLAMILGSREEDLRRQRLAMGLAQSWEAVPVSGVENAALGNGKHAGGGAGGYPANRLSPDGETVLRSGRARHGSGAR